MNTSRFAEIRGALVTTFVIACASISTSCNDSGGPSPKQSITVQEVGAKHVAPVRPATFASSKKTPIPLPSAMQVPLGAMTYHNGQVLTTSSTYAIFWGTSWGTDTSFTTDKITGLEAFFGGFGGSNYARTLTEYYWSEALSGDYRRYYMTTGYSFVRSLIDNSPAPSTEPTPAALVSEVASVLSANGIAPAANTLYSVYATTPRDTSYCAWHSWGTINGVLVTVAWYFNLDNDNGCDPADSSGLHSQGLAALANMTGHELSETITDPYLSAWFTTSALGENADKCAWVFDVPLVALANGTQFKIQGNWSNKAFNAGYGYANNDGEHGCLSGQTWPHVIGSIDCCNNPPSQVAPQHLCTWRSSAIGGTAPYTYSWQNEGPMGNVVPPSGSGSTFQTEAYNTGHFVLRMIVTDGAGVKDTTRRDIRSTTDQFFCN